MRDLFGNPFPVAQKGNKVLAVTPQQVIRNLLTDEHLRLLDDLTDGQGCVVVVIFVVDTIRIASYHLLQQLHTHHSLPAEDGLHTGHGSSLAFICVGSKVRAERIRGNTSEVQN